MALLSVAHISMDDALWANQGLWTDSLPAQVDRTLLWETWDYTKLLFNISKWVKERQKVFDKCSSCGGQTKALQQFCIPFVIL